MGYRRTNNCNNSYYILFDCHIKMMPKEERALVFIWLKEPSFLVLYDVFL